MERKQATIEMDNNTVTHLKIVIIITSPSSTGGRKMECEIQEAPHYQTQISEHRVSALIKS